MNRAAANARRFPAEFCEPDEWESVSCHICPLECIVAPGRAGVCGVRSNRNGVLYLDAYGRAAATAIKASQDLPVVHTNPAGSWLEVSLRGCNMKCPFCSTATLSQIAGPGLKACTAASLIEEAQAGGAGGIAFGGSEPAVCHEFVRDTLALARDSGLTTAVLTNGMWSPLPFEQILPVADVVVFGFKGFEGRDLASLCGGQLQIIQANAEQCIGRGVAVELNFLCAGSGEPLLEEAARFGQWARNLGSGVPVVVQARHPAFQWTEDGSRSEEVAQVARIIGEVLPHVYCLSDSEMGLRDTHCSNCGRVLVRRTADCGVFMAEQARDTCPSCGAMVPFFVRMGPGVPD